MHNIEEKGAVSTNGIGLSNGLSNKETDDTWADLNKAIDNEINGCSEDANDKPSFNDKQITIKKNDVISETSSNSANDKPDKTIIKENQNIVKILININVVQFTVRSSYLIKYLILIYRSNVKPF